MSKKASGIVQALGTRREELTLFLAGSIKEEISQARARLDQLLQTISENRGVSPVESDEDSELVISEAYSVNRDGDVGTPRKRHAQSGKKRKRGGLETETKAATSGANSHVVRLFDRSVDLLPFKEDSALYPMCRAWVKNSASEQCMEQPKLNQLPVGGEAQFPTPYMVNEDEDLSQIRIPQPIRRADAPLNIYASRLAPKAMKARSSVVCPGVETMACHHNDVLNKISRVGLFHCITIPEFEDLQEEDAEGLLIGHLAHWKKVRESWRVAGRNYEARFATSHSIIKQMFESAAAAAK